VDWIHVAQDREPYRAHVNTVMNLVAQGQGNFLTSRKPVGFSTRILLNRNSATEYDHVKSGNLQSYFELMGNICNIKYKIRFRHNLYVSLHHHAKK